MDTGPNFFTPLNTGAHRTMGSTEGEVQRFLVVCGLAVVNLLYAREVVIRAKVPPGWGRLLLFMPCLISHVYFPSKTLDPFEEVLASAVSFTNFGWWTNFKLMGLAFGRGQLVGKVGSPLMFLAAGALPIKEEGSSGGGRPNQNPDARRTRSSSAAEAKVSKELSPTATLVRACCRIPVLCTVIYAAPRLQVGSFALNLCYSFGLYAVLGFIFDLAGLVSSSVFCINLSPHFDMPFLSTSATNFWAKRWNLVAGTLLREVVYEPIIEGSMTATPTREQGSKRRRGKAKKPSAARRLAATTTCFLASGLAHEIIMWYMCGAREFGWEWTAFFTAQAPLCTLEWFIKRRTKLRFPTPLAIVVFLTVELTIAKFLFFPPVVRQGLDQRVINDVKRILGLP